MLNETVRSHLDAHRDENLAALTELLRFESISAQPDHHDDCVGCAHWLARRLEALGLKSQILPGTAKPLLVATGEQRPDRPTLLIYGHYDVQPPEPLKLWTTPPFEPTVRDGDLYARGASDDKGPLMAWIAAAEAYRAVGEQWPVNLKFCIEGEEEIGSPTLEDVIAAHAELLRCDHIAISDTAFFAAGIPSITTALRGLAAVEVTLTGPSHDLHSGLYGGIAPNPLHALAALVAGLHDSSGRVTLEGFYDDVVELTDTQREQWRTLNFDEAALAAEIGVDRLTGEAGYTALERNWARPALDCNGLWGGYCGDGPKTVIASWAKAKLSVRLVPRQDPRAVNESLDRYFQKNRPAGTRVELTVQEGAAPWLLADDAADLPAARAAMTEAFGAPCALIGCGASVPITVAFKRCLGIDPLMMGYALPGDRVHSPNERFRLANFFAGAVASAALMANLAETTDG